LEPEERVIRQTVTDMMAGHTSILPPKLIEDVVKSVVESITTDPECRNRQELIAKTMVEIRWQIANEVIDKYGEDRFGKDGSQKMVIPQDEKDGIRTDIAANTKLKTEHDVIAATENLVSKQFLAENKKWLRPAEKVIVLPEIRIAPESPRIAIPLQLRTIEIATKDRKVMEVEAYLTKQEVDAVTGPDRSNAAHDVLSDILDEHRYSAVRENGKELLGYKKMAAALAKSIEKERYVSIVIPSIQSRIPEARVASSKTPLQRTTIKLTAMNGANIELVADLIPQEVETVKRLSSVSDLSYGDKHFGEVYYLLFDIMRQGRCLSAKENGKPVEMTGAAKADYTGKEYKRLVAKPMAPERESEPAPAEMVASSKTSLQRTSLELIAKDGTKIELDVKLTDREIKAINQPDPFGRLYNILYNLMEEGRCLAARENGKPIRDINSALARYIDKDYAELSASMPSETGPEVAPLPPSERIAKNTTMAMAFSIGNYTTLRMKGGQVDINTFILSYEPTEEELARYGRNPKAFRDDLERTFGKEKDRQAFLSSHRDISIRVPAEGLQGSELAERYPDGITLSSRNKDGYNLIRNGIFGSTFDAYGASYASGFTIDKAVTLPTTEVKSEDLGSYFDIRRRAPDDMSKGGFRIGITSERTAPVAIDFTSDGRRISVFGVLMESEAKAVEGIAGGKDTGQMEDILSALEKNHRILRIYQEGKERKDIKSAIVGDYIASGIDSVERIRKSYNIQFEVHGSPITMTAFASDAEARRIDEAIRSEDPERFYALLQKLARSGSVTMMVEGGNVKLDIEAALKRYEDGIRALDISQV